MAELSPLLMLFAIIFSMVVLIATPLIGSLILFLFARWFKFKKTDFKTAFYSVIIVFGILIAISSALSMFFFDKIMQWQNIFTILALLISFIAGFFIVYKFYKETPLKCFGVWSLTCVTGVLLFFVLIIIIALLFGQFI